MEEQLMPTALLWREGQRPQLGKDRPEIGFLLQRASVPGQAVSWLWVWASVCTRVCGRRMGRCLRPPLGNTAGTTCIHPQPELTHVQTSQNPGHLGL